MAFADYADVLRYAQWRLAPRTYLEVGIFQGRTFRFAGTDTLAVGVDPEPMLGGRIASNLRVYPTTSDDFFDTLDPAWVFNGRPLDFAFIDGMHLFEYALRDFVNVERRSHAGSIIAMHDCSPTSEEMTGREYLPELLRWTGDVWKVPYYLMHERSDLRVSVIDAPPTGLTVIQSLDPDHGYSDREIEKVIKKYQGLTYDDYLSFRASLPVVPLTRSALDEVFPPAPFGTLSTGMRTRRAARAFRQALMTSALAPWLRSIRGGSGRRSAASR